MSEPFIQKLADKFAEEIRQELQDRGINNIPGEGEFCPCCGVKMTGKVQIAGYYTRPGADLWICMDCSEALMAERLVWAAGLVKQLPLKDRVALCFRGVTPQSWLDHWHKLCKRFG